MPPTAARRHRSRSSVDSLLELVHGLNDHDVHRLLADLNNTTEGNVAVAKALDIFQKPSSPKFEFGSRHVSNPSPSLLVSRSRRPAADHNNYHRGYNNDHYTHLRLHHATNSPASKAQAPADGCVSNSGTTFGKRISSAPLLDRERALPPRQSPTTCETLAESQPTNICVPSRGRPPSTPTKINFSRPVARSPGSPLHESQTPCLFVPSVPPPVPVPESSPPPPQRASSQGRRAYKRISRPKFHLPLSAAANSTTQTSLHVPAFAFPGDGSREQDEDGEHGQQQPDLRALLLAAYTLGDGCNLPVPPSPQSPPLRGPRSMVNLRSLRQQQEQDDEFWFDGRRPTTPDNMLLEPLPRLCVAAPTARMDPWRMDSLSAILNEA
ncbi:hypothetical protein PgNI_10974 [Pyricularia grisea]|uniref:Uncharacterized protein n=1 Tax=Pyricularia grisea TaxID=148305 RepID=A0A6P8AZ11_PYRGI|nr:hypothetical protein PgNI_10974 [Pyricularia grisea]TLD07575.1 hypothetical protein PgNI_10974 [Pyricularia grisea]